MPNSSEVTKTAYHELTCLESTHILINTHVFVKYTVSWVEFGTCVLVRHMEVERAAQVVC